MSHDVFDTLGLKHNPFSMAADTQGYFHTDATKMILDELAFGILSRKGFLLLSGEVGVGKTSLLYQLLRRLEGEQLVTSWIFNTMLNKEELLHAIARDFGLEAPKTANIAQLVDILQGFLVEQNSQDRNCAIIVDEAHNLSLPAMEALRMLSNLETAGRKLVQILLVGQPELKERMDEPKLRQLRSRITIYRELLPFTLEETGRYVNFKLAAASSQFRISKKPLGLLHQATVGNTRMINLIMERSLYAAVAFGEQDLTVRVLRAAVDEIASCQIEVAQRLRARKKRLTRSVMTLALAVLLALVFVPWVPSGGGASSPFGLAVGPLLPSGDGAPGAGALASLLGKGDSTKQNAQAAPQSDEKEKADESAAAENEVKKSPAKENEGELKKKSPLAVAAKKDSTAGTVGNNSLTEISKPETQLGNTEPVQSKRRHPKEYVQFLKPFGLDSKVSEFAQLVEDHDLARFERVLTGGVQLLQVDRLPKNASVDFTAFPWRDEAMQGPLWLVLWRPPFVIQDFYYGYRNENILALQRMLKRLGYYWGPDDGMVGPVTWRAINSFQKDMKLKRTMWPDPETVFWLNVMSKQG